MTTTGFAVVLATEPERSAEFFRDLRALVRDSHGGVLISLRRPARWPGGPVVGIHLRCYQGAEHLLRPGIWLGPLREEADQQALCEWLRLGGPQVRPLPQRLLARTLPGPTAPPMASQTVN
jgi:hypothetical protein